MDTFINFCIITASVILIVILTVMGILTYRNSTSVVFPPVISNCPDYWYDSYDPNSIDVDPTKTRTGTCYNKMNLGNPECSRSLDFSKWGMCKKQTWARKCNITWDGVTNSKNVCKHHSINYDANDVAPPPEYEYQGCYNDNKANPDQRAIATFQGNVTSVQQCSQIAKQKGASVFGLQNGEQCFTGSSINDAKKFGIASSCGPLGNPWTNQVYYNSNG